MRQSGFRWWRSWAFTAIVLVLFGVPLNDVSASAKTLRIGTPGDYAPYSQREGKERQYQGLDIDLIRAFSDQAGYRIVWVPTTWTSLMRDLKRQKFQVAVGGISLTPEREAQALVTVPYVQGGKILLVRCESVSRFKTLSDVDQPTVRVVENAGGTNEAFARKHLSQAQLIIKPKNQEAIQSVLARQADVMITDVEEAQWIHRHQPALCVSDERALFTHEMKVFLVHPKHPDLQQRLNHWLVNVNDSGALPALKRQWLGE